MRSTFTRLFALSVAAALAASAVAPASAATRHKRAAPAQSSVQAQSSDDVIGLPIHPAWSPIPSAVYQAPNSCFTDEGYGRYTSCEQGGT